MTTLSSSLVVFPIQPHPSTPRPDVTKESLLETAIYYHEINELFWSTFLLSQSASQRNVFGMLLYAVSLRHGFGCTLNQELSAKILQSAAQIILDENQKMDLDSIGRYTSKADLAMIFYELSVSFRNGWGLKKDKVNGLYYLTIAARLGDKESMQELGYLYLEGTGGVKKDKKTAAKWFRLCEKAGGRLVQMQWIWKEKYNEAEGEAAEKDSSENAKFEDNFISDNSKESLI